ncbi:serine/threonine-protein phosphatase 2A 56 kDa regulatory subunit delta isoform-like isoform X1 [Perca fluviatilis]|uniref:serine/threonine-protein phosphatase 2A 56 kDa regulatory subunit delta isoform-like isoform X1 n=1 Tax=Perca fluviatilis TaxID=8168 RepID=UPI001966B17E|nr:serine/threonine-protein phosphatase 2A 56 kDa regulatory subunit delta isoform-like isoform X1 [Perca fluviatilis]
MPHKSKKEKETKSGRSKKSESKNGPADEQDGSNKKVPPATQVMRVKQPGSHSAAKREKRFSTSFFPLSVNRELQKLLTLADCDCQRSLSCWCRQNVVSGATMHV